MIQTDSIIALKYLEICWLFARPCFHMRQNHAQFLPSPTFSSHHSNHNSPQFLFGCQFEIGVGILWLPLWHCYSIRTCLGYFASQIIDLTVARLRLYQHYRILLSCHSRLSSLPPPKPHFLAEVRYYIISCSEWKRKKTQKGKITLPGCR